MKTWLPLQHGWRNAKAYSGEANHHKAIAKESPPRRHFQAVDHGASAGQGSWTNDPCPNAPKEPPSIGAAFGSFKAMPKTIIPGQ